MRYIEAANGSNAAPKTILELATAPASGAVTLRLIWDGQTAPTPSARDLSKNAGATVAGGMGKDGYIYAMRAIGTQEPGWDLQGGTWAGPNFEWRTHHGTMKCCAMGAMALITWALFPASGHTGCFQATLPMCQVPSMPG